MNVIANIGAFAQARITPADAVSRGVYEIGMRRAMLSFSAVDQVYSVSAVGIDGDVAGQLNVAAGTFTGYSGGSVTGGGGEDPDGVTVALSLVHALHFRNTGDESIFIETAVSGPLGAQAISMASVPAGGEILMTFPGGLDFTGNILDISAAGGALVPISFDIAVFGQL
jgi:hypothetical protein